MWLVPPFPSGFPAFARMTNSLASYGGRLCWPSTAGDNYFRTNRPCRLSPAHRGMETRGAGWWKDSGVIGGASPCLLAGANLPSILAKFR